MGCLNVTVKCITDEISAYVNLSTEPITVHCSVVCGVSTAWDELYDVEGAMLLDSSGATLNKKKYRGY
jgi:hypothetical protein